MKIRKSVKDFQSYSPGSSASGIRMDKNESPFSLPAELKQEVLAELEKITLNRYPPSSGDSLREKLAKFHDVKRGNVVVGSGSDQLISYSSKLFSGTHAVITPPTFSMYRFYSELNGLAVKPVPLEGDFGLQLEEIKANLPGAALLFLCSPNNPTGNVFPREEVIELLDTGVPIILDEAYGEFAEESNIDLINKYDNLLIIRTFSKAFGLAGARVGYALGDESTMEYLLKVKPPYNLNSFSLKIAEVLLENYELVRERATFLINQRENLYEKFEKYSYPSQANFLLMDLNAADFLVERGIVVRSFKGRLASKIRVTLGREEENEKLTKSLEDYISAHVER